MIRYRIRYSKEGAARFISHLDMVRTFERVVRRASLPVSLSEGFNPHPKFGFGFPLPVGMAGQSEYVDLMLDSAMDPDQIVSSLERAMPPGLRVTGACLVEEEKSALMAQVERSVYQVRAAREELPKGVETLRKCLEDMMGMQEITISRRKKDGRNVIFDIRPGLLAFSVREDEAAVVIEMELMTSSSLNVRPEEVIEAVRGHCGLLNNDCHLDFTRTGIAGPGGKDLFRQGGKDKSRG